MLAGEGSLVFDVVGARTTIVSARAHAPLKLLTPHNHGSARWTYVATYGGGLVDGDAISLDVRVGPNAKAFLGTQASTKVYRGAAKQTLVANVADDALLVAFPDPLTPFAGARYEQRATLHLAPRAALVWVDVLSSGRVARGERWAFTRYVSRTQVLIAGRLVVDDALVLDSSDQDIARAMGRFNAFATMFLVGRGWGAKPPKQDDVVFASSEREWGRCVRVAAASTGAIVSFLREALTDVRASLGDDPFSRKW